MLWIIIPVGLVILYFVLAFMNRVKKCDGVKNVLMLMACEFRLGWLARFLIKRGANPKAYYEDSEDEALYYAVNNCDYRLMAFLAERIGVNREVTKKGYTPLMLAVMQRDLKMVCMLLSLSADVNAVLYERIGDKDWMPSPLYFALESNGRLPVSPVIVALLLHCGANADYEYEFQENRLQYGGRTIRKLGDRFTGEIPRFFNEAGYVDKYLTDIGLLPNH